MGNKKGFTLIELVIVLAIMSIIAAIAISAYTGNAQKARESSCAANVNIIQNAASVYYAQTGKWPSSIDVLMSTEAIESETYGPWLKPPKPVCPVDPDATYFISADGKVTCSH